MTRRAIDDTIVALSSGRPPAAIAVVRTSGRAAFAAAAAIAGPLPPPRTASLRILRDPRDQAPIDRALVLCFAAPDTATGEDIVEYQCHGGRAVVDALIAALISFDGVRGAEPGEFTRRALGYGRIDLTQAEGLAELLEAETEAQRHSALKRSEGALRSQIEAWRAAVLDMAAEAEVAIDYADEDDGTAAYDPAARLTALAAEIEALLAAPRVEKLRDGVRVVVAGPPNAGKSSLVNALAGQPRAIVTPIAGTTRDRIEVPLAIDGLPLVLVDTAGLRDSDDSIERIGVRLARQEIEEADILLWLGGPDDLPDHRQALLVAAKCDIRQALGLAVSAVTGAGIDALKAAITGRAAEIVPAPSRLALNQREADLLKHCAASLHRASLLSDPVLSAE
ncbi:MAG: tRNA uridine-5-carboxymethylaminomethyl(34) synthesis GTPase MnmE, partial [Sphingomonas bacterium]|nr:tRNA uridine-5-carboxymethylaminomethyl(34) synthesis GTPase MnmE [Sphingomonas bacterium]